MIVDLHVGKHKRDEPSGERKHETLPPGRGEFPNDGE